MGRGRRCWGIAVVVALAPLLTACDVWEQLGHGPDNTRFNPDEAAITPENVGSLAEQWSVSVNGKFSEPVLSGGKLYTTVSLGFGGSVRAYDVATGGVVWEKPLNGSPVILVDGALWLSQGGSGCTSQLTRLDPATGDVLTTEPTTVALSGTTVVQGTTVASIVPAACGPNGNQAQLAVRDGGSSWTFAFPAGVTPSAPSMGGGKIVVSAGDKVYAFAAAGCGAATCEPLWATALAFDGTSALADGRPAVGADGVVYVPAFTQTIRTSVAALDAATGEMLWHTALHQSPGIGWQNLAVAHGQVYVSDHGSGITVFAAAGCGQPACDAVWSGVIDGAPVAGPTVGGDVLYLGVSGAESHFAAFDATGCGSPECPRLANAGVGNRQPMTSAVAGGHVAVVTSGSGSSTLHVLAPEAG